MLETIRDNELNQLQFELFAFATSHFEFLLTEMMDDFLDGLDLLEEEEDLVSLYFTVWAIFSVQIEPEETIFTQFLNQKKKNHTLRSSTLQQLEAWDHTVASFSIVKKIIDDLHIEVEDVITNETKQVKLSEKHEDIEEGGILLGFLLPYGNYYSYFTMYLDFSASEASSMAAEVLADFDASDYPSAELFMVHEFPKFLLGIFAGQMGGPDLDQLNWTNPKYEEVAEIYKEHSQEEELPKQFQDLGVMLWFIYCQQTNPYFRKPEIYAAALHYLVNENIPFFDLYTQSEIAEIYEVSTASLSKAYHQLKNGLEDELEQIADFMTDDIYDLLDDEDIYDEDDYDEEDDDYIDLEDLFFEEEESSINKKKK